MQVQLKLFATLSKYAPDRRAGSPFQVELPDGATVEALVSRLSLPEAEVKVVFINARAQPLSYVLKPGDEVGIFPAVGGG